LINHFFENSLGEPTRNPPDRNACPGNNTVNFRIRFSALPFGLTPIQLKEIK